MKTAEQVVCSFWQEGKRYMDMGLIDARGRALEAPASTWIRCHNIELDVRESPEQGLIKLVLRSGTVEATRKIKTVELSSSIVKWFIECLILRKRISHIILL